jgi:hypothetical protein
MLVVSGNASVNVYTNEIAFMRFEIISNSTISGLAFNSTSEVLEFTVSGPSGTTGFTNVTIAKTLMSSISMLKVYLDGNQINYTINDLTYAWLIHFTYHQSTHEVVMSFLSPQAKTSAIPLNEVAVAIILLAIATFTALVITIKRKTKFSNFSNFIKRKQLSN